MKNIIISIDGPAASGKGKIASYISRKWKLKHLDSGILYRKLAYDILKNNLNTSSVVNLKKFIKNHKYNSLRRNKSLRSEQVSKMASKIAIYKFIRNHVNKYQKDFVKKRLKNNGFVIDGRDIGSVVFKDANLKLYIDVDEKNRAKRRYKQLIDRGEKSIYPKILKEIKLRDKKDKHRINSPLIIPKGAIIVSNNGLFKETTEVINKLIKNL